MAYIEWLRSKIGHQKILLVFGCAIIRDEQGRVLWQQRGDFGWWGLPGGVLEFDETLSECVAREVLEETHLLVEPLRLVGIYSSPDYDVLYPNGDQVQQVTFTFECRVTGGDLKEDGVETICLAWRNPDDPPETSRWYQDMLTDFNQHDLQTRFSGGSPGKGSEGKNFIRMLRKYIAKDRFIMPGTSAVVRDATGRVLLQKRTDDGRWNIPGGAMELGERIDQTIRRELLEETGLVVEVKCLSGVYSDAETNIVYPNGDQLKVALAVFCCEPVGGSLRADGQESSEVRFFELDHLPPLDEKNLRWIKDAWNSEVGAKFR